MNAVDQIASAVRDAGYRVEAVVSDYSFADVLADDNPTRTVQLAAFTRTPPSYRSAALAVVDGEGRQALDVVSENRALGAPLLFVIDRNEVTVWEVRSKIPRAIETVAVEGRGRDEEALSGIEVLIEEASMQGFDPHQLGGIKDGGPGRIDGGHEHRCRPIAVAGKRRSNISTGSRLP